MGSSILGFLVWISLLLATNHSSVLANLTNTTLYSTHPQFAYAPESCCMKGPFGRCMKRYDPFTMTTYVDSGSKKRTFFQTSSWGNEPDSSNMKRRVEISFYGQAVYVYSPPRAQLDDWPGTIQISLNGLVLATIDLEAKYRETDEDPWSPRLIYNWQGVGVDASHTLQISLLDSASDTIRGFGIDSVVYTSLEPRRPPRYQLSESEKLEEVVIHDTNSVMTFTPTHAWEKHISDFVSSEGIRTFHGTSNELAYTSHDTTEKPVAEFTAKCAGVAIYGASPTQIEATFADGFRHGHLQICLGRTCEYIDAHQAYLHVPEHLRDEPVLIYSTDQMSPRSLQAVKMRFLDPPSPVGHLWTTTFSHAVCFQVLPKRPIVAAILAAAANIVFTAVAVVLLAVVAVGSSSQFARPAVRAVRPSPLTSADSDILPQYFDHTAPPSYDACITSDAVITIPPQLHAPITVPAPPPPRRT